MENVMPAGEPELELSGSAEARSQEADADASEALSLEDVVRERDKYRDLAIRSQAEFENYQKRVARDNEQSRKFAVQFIVADLLNVVDDLERATESAKKENAATAIVEGIELVHKQMLETLARHGVEAMTPLGGPFDPNQHEALMQQPAAEHPPMTVLHVLRRGYRLYDRVVRPAQVVVSTAAVATAAGNNG